MADQKTWDERYLASKPSVSQSPVDFLADHIALLPKGKALDIAMGQGRNALFLAEHGFQVTGIDSSQVGIDQCQNLARERGLTLTTIQADLTEYALPKAEFDVVINCYYLQRDLIGELKQSLRVGGVIVFETLNADHIKFDPHFNPEYLLQQGELLQFFRDYSTLVYREGILTNPETGQSKSVSSLIARKNRRG
jgi:2-polyprenyl-3-methyl-5-hydroxy-6-metoxy-1,4-benzoquinol methylase